MKLSAHSARDYADAMQALLPPGAAWQWPAGGLGDEILLGTAQELTRVETGARQVLADAIDLHRPKVSSWNISEYRRVAESVIVGMIESLPRSTFAIGGKIGQRLWSSALPNRYGNYQGHHHGAFGDQSYFPIDRVQIDHLVGPFRIGSKIGSACWGHRARYVLRVRYYKSVVDPKPLWDALTTFKQAHVYLWFEDITGSGGHYASN